MDKQIALSAEALAEIQAHRKVNAIKLVRAEQGIGLKEAKEIVDAYIDERPSGSDSGTRGPRKSGGGLLFIAMVIVLAYGLYKYLS